MRLCCLMTPDCRLLYFADTPTYVVYHELILTSKEYMTQVTSVDAYWLGASHFSSRLTW